MIRYAVLPAGEVFNLTSPRWLPEVSRAWRGREGWHSARYDPLRDLIERLYVDGFNAATGHYRRLEESIRSEGIRNPVMVTYGGLERRQEWELPPVERARRGFVSEYLGGSRLWVAQRLGIDVPCIITDLTGSLSIIGESLSTEDEIRARFADQPEQIVITSNGRSTVRDLPYIHLPDGERYSALEQIRIRRGVIDGILPEVDRWLAEHDR